MEAITHDVMKRCLADDPKVSQGIGGDNMTFLVVNLKAQALSPEKKLNASEGKDNDDDLSSCPSLSPMSEDGKSADSSL